MPVFCQPVLCRAGVAKQECGGRSVELNFTFLTSEARAIADSIKAQVDQLITERDGALGELTR
jgi:hypothetical protein